MIIDYSISNFRSIRDKQTLSFEATKNTHLEDYFIVKKGKYRILKIATIIGANASGKSNMLKALYMFPKLLLKPCKDKTSIIEYDKFALDIECKSIPSTMSVNFIVGEVRYFYEVTFDNKIVHSEVLKCQPFDAQKEHTVYQRTTEMESLVSSFKWGDNYRSVENTRILSGNLLYNRTLFGAYLNSNVDISWMNSILDWLDDYIMPLVTTGDQHIRDYVTKRLESSDIDKQVLISQIKKADVGVCDLNIEKKKERLESDLVDALLGDNNVPSEMKEHLKTDPTRTILNVFLSHNGYQGIVPFNFREESGGTQRYYELTGLLMLLIREPHILAIDELECRLHPDLYQHFITTYLLNSKNSQLVLSSHMREFLADKDLFRDDSVWIAEKRDTGDTELYSLADFDTDTLRGVSSRYNAYRAGRLGGIPRLGDTFVELNSEL